MADLPEAPMCCERTFPDPDPMFRFIDPDEGPDSFWLMSHNLRSQRLRVYLLCLSSFEHPLMAWLAAISMEPDDIEIIHEMVDINNRDDERIEQQLALFHAQQRSGAIDDA